MGGLLDSAQRLPAGAVAAAAFALTLGVGVVDYGTGIEYRVFPLYFLPTSLAAWFLGRAGTVGVALLGAGAWLIFNYLGGLRYSHGSVWVVNFGTQATALAVVGLLIATVRAALERETRLSRTDVLTGLLNARAFCEEAERVLALARRQHAPVTLAFLDLDGFKGVNERAGHQGGDELLCGVAEAVRSSLRVTDVAARMGGDEFVVLLPATGAAGAAVILDRLRGRVAGAIGPERASVTVSIGAVTAEECPLDVDTLLQQADRAMYAAKAAGKNQVRLERLGGRREGSGRAGVGSAGEGGGVRS